MDLSQGSVDTTSFVLYLTWVWKDMLPHPFNNPPHIHLEVQHPPDANRKNQSKRKKLG